MKTIITLLAISATLLLAACVGVNRSNGDYNISVIQSAPSDKGLAPTPGNLAASGAVNIIIHGNTAHQDATKSTDALKANATAAISQNGEATNASPIAPQASTAGVPPLRVTTPDKPAPTAQTAQPDKPTPSELDAPLPKE